MDTEPPQSSSLFAVFSIVPLIFLMSELVPGSVFLLFLLLASALISGSEVAFFSLDQNDINKLQEEQSKSSKRILKLLSKPSLLLSTILVANNLINIGIILLSGFLIERLFPDALFAKWASSMPEWLLLSPQQLAWTIQFFVTVVMVTFILVLFGEVTPKVYANWNKMQFSKLMSFPLFVLNKVFFPISALFAGWTDKINQMANQNQVPISKEELDKAISLTMKDTADNQEEVDMLKAVIHFTEVPVKQIMRSRREIFAINWDQSWKEIIAEIKAKGFSRVPVYKENMDNIVGILYVKDLIHLINPEQEVTDWHQYIRDRIIYTPENTMLDDLLKEFQNKKTHLAIVVDEYGGTSGLVTMEDILEEVVGDIKDEFDEKEPSGFIKIDEKNYIFEGSFLINDMSRILDLDSVVFDEIRGDSSSIAGLLLEVNGNLPKLNQEFSFNNLRFKVLSVNKKRIQQVKLTVLS